MKVFLIGPTVGVPYLNGETFSKVASALHLAGFDVINPLDIRYERFAFDVDNYPTGVLERDQPKVWTPELRQAWSRTCLQADTEALYQCDAICLLPGWDQHGYPIILRNLANVRGMWTIFAPDVVIDADIPEEPGDDDDDPELADVLPIAPSEGRAA